MSLSNNKNKECFNSWVYCFCICIVVLAINGCISQVSIYRDIKKEYSYRPNSQSINIWTTSSKYILYFRGKEPYSCLGERNDSLFKVDFEKIDNQIFNLKKVYKDSNYHIKIANIRWFNNFDKVSLTVNDSTFELDLKSRSPQIIKLKYSNELTCEFTLIRMSSKIQDTFHSSFNFIHNVRGGFYEIDANMVSFLIGYRSGEKMSDYKYYFSGPYNDTLVIEGLGKFYKDDNVDYFPDAIKDNRKLMRKFKG